MFHYWRKTPIFVCFSSQNWSFPANVRLSVTQFEKLWASEIVEDLNSMGLQIKKSDPSHLLLSRKVLQKKQLVSKLLDAMKLLNWRWNFSVFEVMILLKIDSVESVRYNILSHNNYKPYWQKVNKTNYCCISFHTIVLMMFLKYLVVIKFLRKKHTVFAVWNY